ISNLNFISKILERIIHSRLSLLSFPALCPYQSAYRKNHSTETALLRIYNDILLSIDQQKVSALVLLDLSAAFDTIDHQILLARLTSNFGITGSAFSLISSYLLNRTQSVTIQSHTSPSSPLLSSSWLSVNPSKTEYLLLGNPQQRSKLVSSSIFFRGNILTPSEKCRNLGVIFDSDLTFKNHISDVCRSSFYHIRQLRRIRA